MKKELRKIFETEYSENKLQNFYNKTEQLYKYYDLDFNLINKLKYIENNGSGKVILKDKFKNIPLTDITILTINNFFPRILAKIAKVNLDNFNAFLSDIINLSESEEINTEDMKILEKYTSRCYGVLQNPHSKIYSPDIQHVVNSASRFLSFFNNEFNDHIVYIDTNKIYIRNFEEIKNRFMILFNKRNGYDLTYKLKKSNFVLIQNKKKLLQEENGFIKLLGLRVYNKFGYNDNLIKI